MRSLFLSAFLALYASLGFAQSFTNMSDAERDEFGAAVRAYLLENPEVIMEAVAVLEQRQAEQAAVSDQQLVAQYADQLFNDGYSHIAGNPEGTLMMVEFTDYKCGYCKRAHGEVLQLLDANPDIRLVVKEYPILGEESILAARAAISVLINEGDEVYALFNDALMLENGPINEISLPLIAESAGADSAAMMEMINAELVTQIIRSNRTLGQQMDVSGTPTFVVANQMLRGYVPLAQMQMIVDEARAASN